MNEFLLSLLLILSFAVVSHASEEHSHNGGPCGKFKLDATQKTQMKEAWFKFKGEKIDLKADLERAKLKYQQLLSDPATDYKTAKEAAKDVADKRSKMIAAKESFKTKVAFEVLKPEQRGPAQMCMRHMKRKGHWHHHQEES